MILPRNQAEQIIALRERGMTLRAIAQQVGCVQNTVVGYIHGRTIPGQRAPRQRALSDFADYCRHRLTDDPGLSTSTLFHELTVLGYAGSRPTFYRDVGRYDLLRLPGEHPRRHERRQPATMSTVIIAGSLRPLPVRVAPLAGEPLASYIGRVAASNHLTVDDIVTVLPEWIGRRVAKHDDRGSRREQPSTAHNALRGLARITGVAEAALAHALPAFTIALPGTRPVGPMRITTACRRCTTARGIHHPVTVHLPSYVQVCVRHGIWLSCDGRPQIDVNRCPEIITAHKHVCRLLHRIAPEQLMFARVTNAHLVRADPNQSWRHRRQLLRAANPGLARTGTEPEFTDAAIYPDTIERCRSRSHTSSSKIH